MAKKKSSSFNSLIFDSGVNNNSPSQSKNSNCNIEKSAHNKLKFTRSNEIVKDCSSQNQNGSYEIERRQSHSCFEGLMDNILITQQAKAATSPPIADGILPGVIAGNKNGITPAAKNICPKLANILETAFICSNDSLCSINYNCNTSRNDVNR